MKPISTNSIDAKLTTIVPTEEQQAIRLSRAQTILIDADAGAAKTTTLAMRIKDRLDAGIRPTSILLLTYTPAACEAIHKQLIHLGVNELLAKQVWISTFERFALYCLKDSDNGTVPYLPDPDQVVGYVWKAVELLSQKRNELSLKDEWLPSQGNSQFVEDFLRSARRIKGRMVREEAVKDDRTINHSFADETNESYLTLRLLGAYERIRKSNGTSRPNFRGRYDGTFDLASMIVDPHVPDWINDVPKWPKHLKAFMVDEMHDLNRSMFEIIKALLKTNSTVHFCGVGDPKQVIFADAGADSRFMNRDFFMMETGRFPSVLPLSASYRCGTNITDAVGLLIGKKYLSHTKSQGSINCLAYEDDIDCARLVIDEVKAAKEAKEDMGNFAILLRHPHQSIFIENLLLESAIPYRTRGLENYLRRPEVALVRAILAVALNDFESIESKSTRKYLVEQLVSFCGVKLEYLEEGDSAEDRLSYAIEQVVHDPTTLVPFFHNQVMRKSHLFVQQILQNAMKIADEVNGKDFDQETFFKLLDALEMPKWAAFHFVEKHRQTSVLSHINGVKQSSKQHGSARKFFAHMNQLELKFEKLSLSARQRNWQSSIQIADISQVKGLEFDHVVIPYVSQGEFPAFDGVSIEDERNLMYVATTRTRNTLTILAKRSRPSPFIEKMALRLSS